MNQEGMFKPALIGGVLLGMLSAIPVISLFNCVCCAWVIGGGMLAAHLYVRGAATVVTLGSGILLGLLTGAIGAVVDTLFTIPIHLALRPFGMGFAEQMRQAIDQLPNVPPETRDALRSFFAGGRGIGFLFIILTGFFKLVVYGVMGMIGGAIGVALFEKRKPGTEPPVYQPPMNIPPPPPPPPPDIPAQP
ncbi:MAG TPA: hypothetical protein VE398_07675 [Acidobacteriota bacterium]|nr:hypothetical protein [Acidobacteriota bacterium]